MFANPIARQTVLSGCEITTVMLLYIVANLLDCKGVSAYNLYSVTIITPYHESGLL